MSTSYKKKILEVSKLVISKAVDFIDITQFVKKSMNEFDNSNKCNVFVDIEILLISMVLKKWVLLLILIILNLSYSNNIIQNLSKIIIY